ncbi:WXG100 family type VII secretion target [Rhodococcoides yunnanense]|uniref:WXG100 family type VII secretion target n=1 Tax=Rhodococcoides yunnanense TaxID=278209 RepID=UPI000932AD41|nr:WXG100 family type VII secretion target [Rhodococcus yunnanensis]
MTELDNLAQRLGDAIETIDRIVGGLGEHASAARLHWTGPAADAYVAVHSKWTGSALDLIALLVEMRTMAQNAQSSYCDTVAANLKMLGRI